MAQYGSITYTDLITVVPTAWLQDTDYIVQKLFVFDPTISTANNITFDTTTFTINYNTSVTKPLTVTVASLTPLSIIRETTDGNLTNFWGGVSLEGNIALSGTTVSYNGAHLARWSQLEDNSKPDIPRGTVMSSTGTMCEWEGEDNEQLTKCKISDRKKDATIAGVFDRWDEDDLKEYEAYNDMVIAQTGDFVIRVTGEVKNGELLESNGDGTARVQKGATIKSSTIAKASVSKEAKDTDINIIPCLLMVC